MSGRRLKSGLFNQYVIVVMSEVFGHNHADLQSVTPALAHDRSVNYSTAPRPKRRGFKLEKFLRKGCDRLEKKTSLLHCGGKGMWLNCGLARGGGGGWVAASTESLSIWEL